MARLIDAKALEKQVKAVLKDNNPVVMGFMLRWIRNQPTVDAVKVVRCKDCKHFDEYTSKCYVFCDNWCEVQLEVDSGHFCSYGERIDNG